MNSCTHQRTMLGRHATKYFYYYYQPTCRKLTPASFKAEIDGRRASPAAVVAQVVQVHVRRVNQPIFSTPMSFAVCSLPLTAVCSIRSEREPRRNVPGGYALADSQSKKGNSFFNSSFPGRRPYSQISKASACLTCLPACSPYSSINKSR